MPSSTLNQTGPASQGQPHVATAYGTATSIHRGESLKRGNATGAHYMAAHKSHLQGPTRNKCKSGSHAIQLGIAWHMAQLGKYRPTAATRPLSAWMPKYSF